jgi:acyl-CoA reductase-like NAD-dependent aldehyde dehydrogenase
MEQYKNYINGHFVDSNKKFQSINPMTEEPWAEICAADIKDVNNAVKAASEAFNGEWSNFLPQQRSKVLRAIGNNNKTPPYN